MKKLLFSFVLSLIISTGLFSIDISSNFEPNLDKGEPIKIIVYGAGGLKSDGTKHHVCPEKSTSKCADIDLPSRNVDQLEDEYAILNLDSKVYAIQIVEANELTRVSQNDWKLNGENLSFIILNK